VEEEEEKEKEKETKQLRKNPTIFDLLS